MADINELVLELERNGVELRAFGGLLCINSQSPIDADLRNRILISKHELLAAMKERNNEPAGSDKLQVRQVGAG